jgi:hypothetical protein
MKKRIKLLLVAVTALCVTMAWPSGGLVYAQSGNIWHVQYFPNLDWSGSPVLVQDVANLNLNWSGGSPGPGVPAENFTALMTTSAAFSAGVYQFSVLADDEVQLQIDGATVLDTMNQGLSGQNQAVAVAMTAGTHTLTVYYRQYTSAAYINMNWAPQASSAPVTLPETGASPAVLPASTNSVITAFGDYTRCIEQGLHQANCFVPNQENSPNLGSIQMEPPIQIWANCTADQTMTVVTGPDNITQEYKCSKTEAGWFPS